MSNEVIVFRFALAIVAAFAFGLARQKLGKPIGFGTFIFLALGSCALALTAMRLTPSNPLPLLGAIVTGIGFLGAGALIRTSDRVVGFTSAATIWIFAVLGLALGVGEYLVAGLLYASIWAVVAIDRSLEVRWSGVHQRRLEVEVPLGTTDAELADLGLPPRARAVSTRLDREEGVLALAYSVKRPEGESTALLLRLQASPLVRRAVLETA